MPSYQPLEAIPLEKPIVGSFLGSLPPLPVPQNPVGDGPAWRNGVAVPSFNAIAPRGWPGASCLSDFEADATTLWEESVTLSDKSSTFTGCADYLFDPFIVYHMFDSADPTGAVVPPSAEDRHRGYVRNWIDIQASPAVARAFYRGIPDDGIIADGSYRNPIPRTHATDLTAQMDTPAAVHPTTAVANLLAAYYGCRQAGGAVLHVPPLILPFLFAHGLVAQVDQRLLGPGGVIVVSDPGMPSTRELFSDSTGSDSNVYPATLLGNNFEIGTDEAWMFVTGPVQASVGELREPLNGPAQVFDMRRNRWVYLLEQPAIFAWDSVCSFAVAVFAPSPAADEV